MTRRRRRLGAVLLAVSTFQLVTSGASGAAATSPHCQVMAFSPTFAVDGTGLCARQDSSPAKDVGGQFVAHNGPILAYATSDFGRHWTSVAGVGLPAANDSHYARTLRQILFSAAYDRDHTVYLAAGSDGLFRSTDLGASWQQSPLPVSADPTIAWLTALPVSVQQGEQPTQQAGALVNAYGASLCTNAGRQAPIDSLVTWPSITPVDGSPCSSDVRFLAPRSWPANPVMLLSNSFVKSHDAEIWACSQALDCSQRVLLRKNATMSAGWFDPDNDAYAYATGRDQGGSFVLLSSDHGAHWRTWTALEKLVRPRHGSMTWSSSGGRMTVVASGGLTPAESGTSKPSVGIRILTSSIGQTWTVTAAAPSAGQPGRATLPFNTTGGLWSSGGRLFVLADQMRSTTATADLRVWCSTNGGRSWSPLCSR